MLGKLKEKLRQSTLGFYWLETTKKMLYKFYAQIYSDKQFIEKLYMKANHGLKPNLQNPQKFTEKLQWLKLYYRDPIIPVCSDKIEAKKYVAKQGYPELIIPTIDTYDSANEIDVEKLPKNFILKASHGSGWNIICRGNKEQIDWKNARKTMNVWLKENLYIFGREWNYKEQKPKLLAEELLAEECVIDYKFMCFNGKAKAVQINHEIDENKYVDFYDEEFDLLSDMGTGICPHSLISLPKPSRFAEMKAIAEDLAKPFPFVRIDLYNINDKIYFGEMTFFPGSGFWTITPVERDLQFGEWLKLPEKSINIIE